MEVRGFELDHKSAIPYHVQLEKYLRALIKLKEYASGESLLPKEESMAKRFGVSRNTVRQAIDKLVQDGLVERKRGVGSKVVAQNISTRLDQWISFTKEMRDKGIDVVEYAVEIDFVKPDKDTARALNLGTDTEVCCLKRVRGAEDAKYLFSISYFHPRIGLTGSENFYQPLYEMLEKECHIVVTVSKEKLKAIAAPAVIAHALDIKKGDPVLKRERVVLDRGDRPVEYNLVYYATDYFSYDIDIKREL
ncbi:GntR family transcriptional regulator [Echinicola strongylocentroti]|uniref:GntR family transcriptional regulator n=1 Tax=Echinicola strongylocentroti TaxID=1795355 RepID=A0A2Z4IQ81_9BACT|nr:GntR family transcriptional regulator [Echinicola strongylocentroti]AWW32954.1 GntR family transcriptional regulator [Echinicola strongylocentroti]